MSDAARRIRNSPPWVQMEFGRVIAELNIPLSEWDKLPPETLVRLLEAITAFFDAKAEAYQEHHGVSVFEKAFQSVTAQL